MARRSVRRHSEWWNRADDLKKAGVLEDKATVNVQASFEAQSGRTDPKDGQPVECLCGWHGTIGETKRESYDGGGALSRRGGYHWHCPHCELVLWRYYSIIS